MKKTGFFFLILCFTTSILLAQADVSSDGTENVTIINNNAKIAFTSKRDGNAEIYVMDANGDNLVRLTNNSAWDECPSWSPDGRKIAFETNRNLRANIYVMDADGSNQVNLTESSNRFNYSPSWSPDGLKIAFYSKDDGRYDIYVMDANGNNQVNLTNNSNGDDMYPSWSPDGSKIAFARDSNIYVMDADGSNQVSLTRGRNPSWSPDGDKIVFHNICAETGKWQIHVINTDGSNLVMLTNNSNDNMDPSWSPDGSKIIFTSEHGDGNREIYVMDVDGSNLDNLTKIGDWDYTPSWGPDTVDITYTYDTSIRVDRYAPPTTGFKTLILPVDLSTIPMNTDDIIITLKLDTSVTYINAILIDPNGTMSCRMTSIPEGDDPLTPQYTADYLPPVVQGEWKLKILCSGETVYSEVTLKSWGLTFRYPKKPEQTPWSTNSSGTFLTDNDWDYTLGYNFKPQCDGFITKLGGYFNGTKTVYLWNADTGDLLGEADVTSANSWSFTDITSVAVNAGVTYTVAAYFNGTGGAIQFCDAELPQTYGDITIEKCVLNFGNAKPEYTIMDHMYGLVDICFTAD